MAILSLGISYRSAPVELLEQLAFPEEDLQKAYDHLTRLPSVEGGVILSTCNRVEIVADVEGYHAGFQELKGFLAESREVSPEVFAAPLYSHYEDQAAEHLFDVSAGIDSMVAGEPQILSQVRAAIRDAKAEGAAGPLLDSLFRHAVRAGRRARAETGISAASDAFIEAGLALAERTLGDLAEIELLVLGAGQMATLAAQALQERGVARVKVLNRSLEHAQALARRTGGSAEQLAHLPEALVRADLVVCSTGATGTIVDVAVTQAAIAERGGRPLFFLDLAVPRDVEAGVADLPGVEVANVDDLGRSVGGGDEGEIAKARSVIADEVANFAAWRRNAALAPLIKALHDRGEQIRLAELRRASGKLRDLSPEQLETVEAALRGAINKLLHEPVVRAKRSEAQADALRALFGLEDEPTPRSDQEP